MGNGNYQALGLAERGAYAVCRNLAGQTNNNGSIRIAGKQLTPAGLAAYFARTIPGTDLAAARRALRALVRAELLTVRERDGAVLVAEWRQDQATMWSPLAMRQKRSRERRRWLAEWMARNPGRRPPAWPGDVPDAEAPGGPRAPAQSGRRPFIGPPGAQNPPAAGGPRPPPSCPPPPPTPSDRTTGDPSPAKPTEGEDVRGVTCHGEDRDMSHRSRVEIESRRRDKNLRLDSTDDGGRGAGGGRDITPAIGDGVDVADDADRRAAWIAETLDLVGHEPRLDVQLGKRYDEVEKKFGAQGWSTACFVLAEVRDAMARGKARNPKGLLQSVMKDFASGRRRSP